jgi:hypothetical protein
VAGVDLGGVASVDEYETGPPDIKSLGTRGVVRLGVSPDDAVLEAEQTVLASSADVHGGAGEVIPKLTDGGGEGLQ